MLVGEYAVGNEKYARPPPKDPNKSTGDLYDTCVDNAANPTIFVTFDCAQSYPHYLIKY